MTIWIKLKCIQPDDQDLVEFKIYWAIKERWEDKHDVGITLYNDCLGFHGGFYKFRFVKIGEYDDSLKAKGS